MVAQWIWLYEVMVPLLFFSFSLTHSESCISFQSLSKPKYLLTGQPCSARPSCRIIVSRDWCHSMGVWCSVDGPCRESLEPGEAARKFDRFAESSVLNAFQYSLSVSSCLKFSIVSMVIKQYRRQPRCF